MLGILLVSLIHTSVVDVDGVTEPIVKDTWQGDQLNETVVEPVLNLSSTIIERGDSINVAIGARNLTSPENLIPDLPFSLWLFDNQTYSALSLLNDTTETSFINYTLHTYFTPNPLDEGIYSLNLYIHLNETFSLHTNATFQVVTNPQANVLFSLSPTGSFSVGKNQNRTIFLSLENVGGSNAFNVTVTIQSIDEPVGLVQSIFPAFIPLMRADEKIVLNFTISPSRFGIGHLSLFTSFTNSEQLTKVGSLSLKPKVLPRVIASFNPINQLFSQNTTTFSITITNLEQDAIQISFGLVSDLISFASGSETQIIEIAGNSRFETSVVGTVLKDGDATVTLEILFHDPDGSDTDKIFVETRQFPVSNIINVVLAWNDLSFWLTAFNVLLLIMFVSSFLYFYFNPKLPNRLFMRLLTPDIPQFQLDTETVVVDGSNVAWERPTSEGKADLRNIDKAVETLQRAGFKNIIVIADAALRYQVSDMKEFDKATHSGKIHVMPAKVSADQFILRLAQERKAMILTNDLFKEYRDKNPWIDDRRIPYTILDGFVYLHPLGSTKDANVSEA